MDIINYIDILPCDIIEKIVEDTLDEHEKTIEKLENINRKIHRKIYGSFNTDKGLKINKTADGYLISFGNIKNKYMDSSMAALLLSASYKNIGYRTLPSLLSSSYLLYKLDKSGIKKCVDYYGFLRPIKLVYPRNYTYGNSNPYITETYNNLIGLDILRETAESVEITCFYNKTIIEHLKKIVKSTQEYYDIFIENHIIMEDDIDYYLVCLNYNNNIGVD
jgi:hypothetical protein